ncbi:MAG: large subunit ribosomal protein L21 [bacterium]|jgi:large subunit ribosomal protein L21
MYAVIKSGGKQYRIAKGQTITVDLLSDAAGSPFETDQVLLAKDDENKVTVGAPLVGGAKVTGTVLEHIQDKKIIVFKKKRRKTYRKTQGHRQRYTRIKIEEITLG